MGKSSLTLVPCFFLLYPSPLFLAFFHFLSSLHILYPVPHFHPNNPPSPSIVTAPPAAWVRPQALAKDSDMQIGVFLIKPKLAVSRVSWDTPRLLVMSGHFL